MANKHTPGPWTYTLERSLIGDNMYVGTIVRKSPSIEKPFAVVIMDCDFDTAEHNMSLMASAVDLQDESNDFADKINATHHYLMGVEQDKTVEEVIGDLFELLGYQRNGLRDIEREISLFDAEF